MAVASELENRIIEKMTEERLWKPNLQAEIPTKWEKHGDLILFPMTAFCAAEWQRASPEFWKMVCEILKAKRSAKKMGPIENNDFRRPEVQILYGENGWVTKKENHIKYRWNITKCMFSSGNISEKLRISSWNCRGETVVDMYAGIGYFTLSYLVHAKADLVYACEINPDAIAALRHNLALNRVERKCIILEGNNVEVCPRNVAHHVNLGLLPSSEATWEVACGALKRGKDGGGILHIHEIINTRKDNLPKQAVIDAHFMDLHHTREIKFANSFLNRAHAIAVKINVIFQTKYKDEGWFAYVNNINPVKSYAPYLFHVVIDVKCCYKAEANTSLELPDFPSDTSSSDGPNTSETDSYPESDSFDSESSNATEMSLKLVD